jgi:ATP:ADP antiporter, AAA family
MTSVRRIAFRSLTNLARPPSRPRANSGRTIGRHWPVRETPGVAIFGGEHRPNAYPRRLRTDLSVARRGSMMPYLVAAIALAVLAGLWLARRRGPSSTGASAGLGLLRRAVDVKPDEVRVLLLSCAYFFFILTSYYIVRPIRDQMGVAGGVQNLPWLFSGTLAGMLVLNPLFSALVVRFPRKQFIPYTYRFFMLNLLVFFVLLRSLPASQQIWLGRAFYIWVSVFNLFVVSVFWAFMTDIFRNEQSKRLFGFIGVGGTLGAIFGASITALFAKVLSPPNLLLVSMVFIEVAVQCVRVLGRHAREATAPPAALAGVESPASAPVVPERVIGGNALAGLTHVARSPYLLGICAYMLVFTVGSTFLYFQQAQIVSDAVTGGAAQTALFARIDLMVNVLTVVIQVFLTGRLLKRFGVSVTLALIPAISAIGFLGLGLLPTLAIVIAFQVARRAGNFAVARPTREVLFTVIPREDKYKAKSFIDTFVYRAGDQVGAWSYKLMGFFGLGVSGIAFVAVPISILWFVMSVWLGRRQAGLARRQADEAYVPAGLGVAT